MTACPEERLPVGWKQWVDPKVPPELTEFAKRIRDKINSYDYGTVAETVMLPDGRNVGVFKSHHTWTYKKQPDGTTKLLKDICIPGASLVVAKEPQAGAPVMSGEGGELLLPHPHAIRFLVTDVSGSHPTRLAVAAAVAVGCGALLLEVALPVAAGLALLSAGVGYFIGKRA